jgi:hypothetical protein
MPTESVTVPQLSTLITPTPEQVNLMAASVDREIAEWEDGHPSVSSTINFYNNLHMRLPGGFTERHAVETAERIPFLPGTDIPYLTYIGHFVEALTTMGYDPVDIRNRYGSLFKLRITRPDTTQEISILDDAAKISRDVYVYLRAKGYTRIQLIS